MEKNKKALSREDTLEKNIRYVLDIINYGEIQDQEGIPVSLDIENAFSPVDREVDIC